MNYLDNATIIVYSQTLELAKSWAKSNIQGTNRVPVVGSPENTSVFVGRRNAIIIFVGALPSNDILYRIQGHGNILIKTSL